MNKVNEKSYPSPCQTINSPDAIEMNVYIIFLGKEPQLAKMFTETKAE